MKERQEHVGFVVLAVGMLKPFEHPVLSVFDIIERKDMEDVQPCLDHGRVTVLLLGSRLNPTKVLEFLTRYTFDVPPPSIILLCAGDHPEFFQGFVDKGIIFYLARDEVTPRQLFPLIIAAADRFRIKLNSNLDAWMANTDELLDFCARLVMQLDLTSASKLLIETTHRLIGVDTVRCLIFDAANETLIAADTGTGREWAESSAAGLAAFVAHTGQRVVLDRAGVDVRYDRESDNPGGAEDVRFIAEPMVGSSSSPMAIIIATRSGKAAEFSDKDIRSLELLSACAAPTFAQILLQEKLQGFLVGRTTVMDSPPEMFRQEALEHHVRNWDQEGDILKSLPLWLRRTYAITLALAVIGVLGMCVARLKTYAHGPALIRATHAVEISAPTFGLVRSIAVSPGNAIRSGDLVMLLETPPKAGQPLGAIAQLRATADGTVGEIPVHPGDSVKSGDEVISIIEGPAQYEVIAFLPETYAPQLHPGMLIRLKLAGGTASVESTEISEISPESLSPSEAMRYMGKTDSESMGVAGRAIMIRAPLPRKLLRDLSPISKFNGTTGEAEVVVRSERVIVALMPDLRKIFEK